MYSRLYSIHIFTPLLCFCSDRGETDPRYYPSGSGIGSLEEENGDEVVDSHWAENLHNYVMWYDGKKCDTKVGRYNGVVDKLENITVVNQKGFLDLFQMPPGDGTGATIARELLRIIEKTKSLFSLRAMGKYIHRLGAKANTMKTTFCWYYHSNETLELYCLDS